MKFKKRFFCCCFFGLLPFTFFSSDCPLQILSSKTYNRDILKTITASCLRFGQMIEDYELIKIKSGIRAKIKNYLVKMTVRSSLSTS